MNLGYMGIFCTIFVNFKLHKNEKYPLHPPEKKREINVLLKFQSSTQYIKYGRVDFSLTSFRNKISLSWIQQNFRQASMDHA